MLRGQLRRGGSGAAAGKSKNQTWPFRAIMISMNCSWDELQTSEVSLVINRVLLALVLPSKPVW